MMPSRGYVVVLVYNAFAEFIRLYVKVEDALFTRIDYMSVIKTFSMILFSLFTIFVTPIFIRSPSSPPPATFS